MERHHDRRLFYSGVSSGSNIEKHASEPLYPITQMHPHPSFSNCHRLIIHSVSPTEDFYAAAKEALSAQRSQLKHLSRYRKQQHKPHFLDSVKVSDLQCDCVDKPLFEKVLGSDEHEDEAMAYKSCKHTIFAAAKRQMKAAPTPEPSIADDFVNYAKAIIDHEVGQYLTHFGYSYDQWYNHLNQKKQKDMREAESIERSDPSILLLDNKAIQKYYAMVYEGICKVEIQALDGKPRMVCSIPKRIKYIMGPITWALEEIFQDHFNGYCGGKNLDQMASTINEYIDLGFTKVVQGDGSGFDNTQDVTLKAVDRYIYQRVAHAVHHVSKEAFLEVSQAVYKRMKLIYTDRHSLKQRTLMEYSILGSVFSGDCDTTLCNTIRMALYNRYVNDKAGFVYGKDYVLFSKGDDFTVMYKPDIPNEHISQAYYRYFLPKHTGYDDRVFGLGQILKMLDFGGPESIKFCSLRSWYKDAQHIILTRDPAKFTKLSKYSRTTKRLKPMKRIIYLQEQATSLMAAYKGIRYFDLMALAYMQRSNKIMNIYHITQAQVDREKMRVETRMQKQIQNVLQTHTHVPEDDIYRLIHDVKYRHTVHKMRYASYWESMQYVERARFEILTPQQLGLINQQIEAEFSTEELKSIMGIEQKL